MILINKIQNVRQQGGDNNYMSKSIAERRQYITDFLINKGIPPVQTAAIVGNLEQENSKFDPTTKNSIGAVGIAQWLGSGRKGVLMKRQDPYDIDTQLNFLYEEINQLTPEAKRNAWTSKKGGRNAFFETQNVAEASEIFRADFERPGKAEAKDENRIRFALNVYEKMGNTVPNPATPIVSTVTNTEAIDMVNNMGRVEPHELRAIVQERKTASEAYAEFLQEREEEQRKQAEEAELQRQERQTQEMLLQQQQQQIDALIQQQQEQPPPQFQTTQTPLTDIPIEDTIPSFTFQEWYNPYNTMAQAKEGGTIKNKYPQINNKI